MAPIEIINYSDPVKFLSDWINYTKFTDSKFSLSKMAGSSKISYSKLKDILKKRTQLLYGHVLSLQKVMRLSESDFEYFQIITKISRSKFPEEIALYKKLLAKNKFKNITFSSVENFIEETESSELYSHWVYIAILTLASVKDGPSISVESIQNRLIFDVDKTIISKALTFLLSTGLLHKDENSKIVRSKMNIMSRSDNKVDHTYKYFNNILELSKSITDMGLSEREIQCFSIKLNHNELPELKGIIRRAKEAIFQLEAHSSGRDVFQVNLNSFPLLLNNKKESKEATEQFK